MARVKNRSAKKHRKTLALAKGFKNARSRRINVANEAVLHAGQYAYTGRRLKKRDLRGLWINRISASVKEKGLSYSVFIKKLKDSNITLNRKILADIAVSDKNTFDEIVKASQK
jgi:large subunit ribosomal protein L20